MHRFRTPLALALLVLTLPALALGQTAVKSQSELDVLIKRNTAFATDLYSQLRQEKENQHSNLFCSPYSISAALTMTFGGARGATAAEMAKVLRFGLDPSRLHAANADLTRELNGHGLPRDYQLSVANSLWGADNIPFRHDFQTLIKSHYGARVRSVDFARNPEAARELINRWVAERTNHQIKDLLVKGDVDPLTAMVLVNAIYFKAAWQTPFVADNTDQNAQFTGANGKAVKVAMMRQTGEFKHFDSGAFQALELPYEGNELSMVVLLPNEKTGLGKLEASLNVGRLESWVAGMKMSTVNVHLPKFKFVSRFDLGNLLSAMGMPTAFTSSADFSGLTSTAKLRITKVVHKAFVDVNEEGTEAAAATAVVLGRPGAAVDTVRFHADHPFLFLIRDNRTGTVLFLGRVVDPTSGAE